ncbi:MAG: hypothetical protein Q8L48_37195 [Archangium sp.]|nr:hypothetical protein [Archangium sp.]
MNRTVLMSALLTLAGCGLSGGDGQARRSREPIVSCPASPAKDVFTAALCLCGDYRAVGEGAWVQGGSAGINGVVDVVGEHEFSGDVVAFGGVSGVGNLTVGGSLSTAGRVDGVGDVRVAGDLSAGSGVSNVGHLEVKGTLRTPEAEQWAGTATVGAKGAYAPLAGPPCGCGAEQVLDVGAAIAAAKVKNDNAAVGLSLTQSVGERALTLGSGSYFFDGIEAVGLHTLTVDGAVAIYVSGSLETVGRTQFKLTEGSTLDLYVDGDVNMVGESSFGAAGQGAVKLYVAGERKVSLVGGQKIIGSVYAPAADLELVGESTFEGALFARNVLGVGRLHVTFAAPVVATPDSELCQPAPVVPGVN